MNKDAYLSMVTTRAFGNGQREYFYAHLQPVIELAQRLSVAYGAPQDECFLAAVFHDIGTIDGVVDDQAGYSAKFAEMMMTNAGFVGSSIETVKESILAQGSTKAPKSAVEAVLRSADGIAQIKFPFFAMAERASSGKIDIDMLKNLNDNAFKKICFEKERKAIAKLYNTRRFLFATADLNAANFCLFSTPKTYRKVVWEVTQTCNMTCKHCLNGEPRKEKRQPLAYYKRVLDEMKEYGIDEIYFTGGEPFSLLHFIDVLEYAHEVGMFCSVATNGTLLTSDIAARINKLGLRKLQVSFDGPDAASHDYIRGKGNFVRAVNGIRMLQNITTLRMSVVLTKGTQDRLEEFIVLAQRLGMNEVIFNWPQLVGRMVQNKDLIPTATENEFLAKYKALAKKYSGLINIKTHVEGVGNLGKTTSPCTGGNRFIFINSEGFLAPCSWVQRCSSEFTSRENVFGSGFAAASQEMKRFTDFIKHRSDMKLSGCPFIAFQRNGSMMSQDPRVARVVD